MGKHLYVRPIAHEVAQRILSGQHSEDLTAANIKTARSAHKWIGPSATGRPTDRVEVYSSQAGFPNASYQTTLQRSQTFIDAVSTELLRHGWAIVAAERRGEHISAEFMKTNSADLARCECVNK